ncbi:MAG: peptidylprolyl isomerase [Dichotomicrobium sp.]
MSHRTVSIVIGATFAVVLAGAAYTHHSVAQDKAAETENNVYSDKVVARVDGTPITEAQLKLARDEMGQNIAQLPEEAQRELILQYVVELTLLADAAREANLDESENYKQLARYYEMRALRDTFFQQEIQAGVTDEAAKVLYDERIGSAEPEPEVKARHILVKTEDEAKAIAKQLADGADFAELAKEKSTGPSSANGGDLGFFSKEQMVTPFAEAAFKMEKGEISEPVKTRFGWHVIKVEDKRDRQPPKFADIKERLKGSLVRQNLQERMAKLRGDADIEILDESLKQDEESAADAQEPATDADAQDGSTSQ